MATTTSTDPHRSGFRLSQLIYDTRYRSITIQVIALILLVAAFWWLISNTVQNLALLGKDFDFGFLGARAGYDINQMLIEYDNSMSHGRAAIVGILNTLLVAFLGCITATVLGVIAGVLRLSKNWIVARLMAVYVEGFRNVPLLLWIVLIFAVMTEATPQPRDFRVLDDGTSGASMLLGDTIAITNRGVFIPAPVWGSGALALLIVFLASLVAIFGYRRWAAARQERTGQIAPTFTVSLALFFVPTILVFLVMAFVSDRQTLIAYGGAADQDFATFAETLGPDGRVSACVVPGTTEALLTRRLLRGGPAAFDLVPVSGPEDAIARAEAGECNLVSLPPGTDPATVPAGGFALTDSPRAGNPVEFDVPVLGGFNFEGGLQVRNSLIALWLALSLYTGAFIAEIVRGGILAISRGQSEASFALGLRPNRTMRLVILPQALRVIIPPLISQYLNLTKNSSLAIAVGYMDVRATLGGITINQTGRELEGMLLLGSFYLALSLLISGVLNVYNNRVKLRER
ncbi:amino acid ABC transporter permease [Wenxinia marina]|uniref:Amine acid ABC transporter, permease protein, 3-TM region, His/Glu/Gln/Arg/opine family n=1 Tax=Wenxinia marina DSM 24838 TaxID=1123501 RepID=A0A0D0QEG6_9RHOB|nr:ABC transporter permease subunit [Wenxinia marina]KIQ70717.1 amine acid ABC transporter, permease protein, 3-TM region, His/Glu/Gln/Arg/opine family [Wenxinia marina DSM 24838]GGL51147.1 amino acid ABC transporter permease [Wenxinia marina]